MEKVNNICPFKQHSSVCGNTGCVYTCTMCSNMKEMRQYLPHLNLQICFTVEAPSVIEEVRSATQLADASGIAEHSTVVSPPKR